MFDLCAQKSRGLLRLDPLISINLSLKCLWNFLLHVSVSNRPNGIEMDEENQRNSIVLRCNWFSVSVWKRRAFVLFFFCFKWILMDMRGILVLFIVFRKSSSNNNKTKYWFRIGRQVFTVKFEEIWKWPFYDHLFRRMALDKF